MKLFEVIDYLLIGIRYGSWVLGVIGIIGSVILGFANVSLGFGAVLIFVATLLLSITLTLLLAPSKLAAKYISNNRKFIVSGIAFVAALVITGIVYWTNGGFPELNLIFI